jgi:hypothetical protein
MTEAVKANETATQLDPENSQEPRQEIRDREKIPQVKIYEKFYIPPNGANGAART